MQQKSKPWKTYFTFIKPYRKHIAGTLLIGMLKFAIPMLLPLLLKYIIDDLLLANSLSTDEKIKQLTFVLISASIVFIVLRGPIEYYRQYFAQWITSHILFDIRNRLFEHIQKLSIRFYQNRKAGEIISRFINDVEQTKNLVEVGMMNVWLDLFTLLIALGFMLYFNPLLTVVAVAVLPLYGLAAKILYKRLKQLTKSRSQALAEIQAYLHERIQGIPVIRSFTLERYEQHQFTKRNQHFLDRAMSQTRWNALTFSIINTLTDIAPLLVLGYGGYLVIQQELALGAFVAFFGYLERMYGPLRRLVNSSTILTQASASLERVTEFLYESYDIQDHKHASAWPDGQGHIQFEHVWFRYREKEDWVLQDINIDVFEGQTVAFVRYEWWRKIFSHRPNSSLF